MNQIKQSDNIGTVGWRNIWGVFTLAELEFIIRSIPDARLSHTGYTSHNINTIENLTRYIKYQYTDQGQIDPKAWHFYIDYPQEEHDRIWSIIQIWLPMIG